MVQKCYMPTVFGGTLIVCDEYPDASAEVLKARPTIYNYAGKSIGALVTVKAVNFEMGPAG